MPRTRKQSSAPRISCEDIDALTNALDKLAMPSPPKGSKSIKELCDIYGCGPSAMERMLATAGAKTTKCRAPNGRAVNYYSL